MGGCQAEHRRAGEVLSRQVHGTHLQFSDQGVESLSGRFAVVAALRVTRVSESREIDGEDAMSLGFEVMAQGEAIFDDLRGEWARQIGAKELADLEAGLRTLVGDGMIRMDAPGWIARDQR